MAHKISDYKPGDTVTFYFIEAQQTGTVLSTNAKEQCLEVKTNSGIIHRVFLSEKESKFCYLKNN